MSSITTLTPSQRFYRTAVRAPRKISTGIDRIPDQLLGRIHRRRAILRRLAGDAKRAVRAAHSLADAGDDDDLHRRLLQVHADFRRGRSLSRRKLVEALACLAAAAREVLGMAPYREQLMGALALERGLLAEMATGEGKTLTVGLAGVLAGFRGHPCHVVTANDYLAVRDANWMAPLFEYCGLSVGHISAGMGPEERRAQYACSVTYCTSQELLADYLRDSLTLGAEQTSGRRLIRSLAGSSGVDDGRLVLRGIHTAILDEADSILIDEAVTPLVISQTYDNTIFNECCQIADEIAATLIAGRDYTPDYKHGEIHFLPAGLERIALRAERLPAIWRSMDRREELIRQALVAREFFRRGKHYIVDDDGVQIVDEYTGRLTPGRTWKQGLHQAIEAKEGIAVTDPTETLASMSFQRFFRLFRRLSGLTGTAAEAASELWHIYRLAVITIPTHRPDIRVQYRSRVYATRRAKWDAVVHEVARLHAAGQPVLVGTRTVEASEELSTILDEHNIAHRVLNAVRHQEEAAVVAMAGAPGQVTIATNMAGRGTDIKVGPEALEKGGLHVIVTEMHMSARIDRQLVGRTGRQGDPGSTRLYVSVEDELFRRFLPTSVQAQVGDAVRWKLPGSRLLTLTAARRAQGAAQRLSSRQRRSILQMDTWLDEHLAFAQRDHL